MFGLLGFVLLVLHCDVGIGYSIRTSKMYHYIRRPHLLEKRLADLEMTTQRIKRLRAICKVGYHGVYFWVIQWCLIDIEYLMAVGEQLLDNTTAHYSRTTGDHYALF